MSEDRIGIRTADGWSLDEILVSLVYFVPRGRTPMPDWRERLAYFAARITAFHHRELDAQSRMTTKICEPFRSRYTTDDLRAGDATFTFLQTLGEVDRELAFAQGERSAFPILLVMSDINWRELDDFFRVRRTGTGAIFDGQIVRGRHVPGSPSGGSRAAYVPDRGIGWALVSGDGWRVPHTGSDCVVYHEGVGHAIGLSHPERPDGSVMGQAQYGGWLHQTWIDDAQKRAVGWSASARGDRDRDLFSTFTAVSEPASPSPAHEVAVRMTWPGDARVQCCHVAYQTSLFGSWSEVVLEGDDAQQSTISLGRFPEPTPVSYRVRATMADGQSAELWGYFQVRARPEVAPMLPDDGVPVDEPPVALDLMSRLATTTIQDRCALDGPLPDAYTLLAVVTPLDDAPALAFELPIGGGRVQITLRDELVPQRPLALTFTAADRRVVVTCEGVSATHLAADDVATSSAGLALAPLGGRYRFDCLAVVPR